MRSLCTWSILPLVASVALRAQESAAGNDPLPFVQKGLEQNQKGDYNAAIDSFNHALAIDPRDSAAVEGRGESHLGQDDLADAISDFSKTLEIEPKNESALYHRGVAESRHGDFKAALSDFDQAVDLAVSIPGESPMVFLERGRAKYLMSSLDDAIADFGQAVTLKPRLGEGYFFRGLAREGKGQFDDAADDFAKAVQLGNQEAALWWWDAKMENHHSDDANDGLTALLSKNPAGPSSPWITELGNLLLQKTTETQIEADATTGKAGPQAQPEAWFFIGLSREFSGDKAGAKGAFEKAMAAGDPNSPLTTESRRHLKQLSP